MRVEVPTCLRYVLAAGLLAMYGYMLGVGDGGLMFHGNIFVGYDWFGSDRGGDRFISNNG